MIDLQHFTKSILLRYSPRKLKDYGLKTHRLFRKAKAFDSLAQAN